MRLAGLSPDGTLVEIVESKSHPWFVGAQFHPEFKSRPNKSASPVPRLCRGLPRSRGPLTARPFLFLQYRWKNGKSYDMMLLPYYWIRQENFNMNHQTIIVLDFGGQYNQLIARRVRECGVYCEVKPYTTPLADLLAMKPIGFIFTGGPNSVYLEDAPHVDPALFDAGRARARHLLRLPAHRAPPRRQGRRRERRHRARIRQDRDVFRHDLQALQGPSRTERDVDEPRRLHGQVVPEGFSLVAHSDACPNVAICDETRGFYGVQFHPEVNHTEYGTADDPQLPLRGLRRDRRLDHGRL